ncbi:MAG: hypothetical protein JXJ04_10355 [Spirochaetales bacterium]|nr:hypothetical protein [Spirochaetales bacterium]
MLQNHELLLENNVVKYGTGNMKSNWDLLSQTRKSRNGKKQLYLKEIKEYHREYEWA